MKKIISVLALSLITVALLVSCSDGKCDECGKKAYELTEEDKKYMKEFDIEIKGEWCEEHFGEKAEEAVMEKFGDLLG